MRRNHLQRWIDLAVRIDEPDGRRTLDGAAYDTATWLSPVVTPGFGVTDVVPSWNATTPGRTWIAVDLCGQRSDGSTTGWYALGRWAADDAAITRTSIAGQADGDASVDADTLVAAPGAPLRGWQLRVTLCRPAGTDETPVLHSAGAVASEVSPRQPEPSQPEPHSGGTAWGTTLAVPTFSQRVHRGRYPQWDGGGGSWCSPTCTAMVLAFWGTGPDPAAYAWVDPGFDDPWVCHAARGIYDASFAGCGNWPFNTAYAGGYSLDAYVTRLRSLADVEAYVAAGIPLVLSVSYAAGQVPGVDYDTAGHLVAAVGFTDRGDLVVNDPAADTDDDVRKIFGRAEFEAAWLSTSGGIAYVARPAHVAVPVTG